MVLRVGPPAHTPVANGQENSAVAAGWFNKYFPFLMSQRCATVGNALYIAQGAGYELCCPPKARTKETRIFRL
jgi:hypothetical protein